jgi:hypothetical protein
MSPEARRSPEVSINPKLAEEFLILLRGEATHIDYRHDELSEEQRKRAEQLINEICLLTPAINRVSLTRMMFDPPIGKNVPGSQSVFGWYDFGNIENWDKPPKEFVDQWKPYRLFARDYYQIGKLERKLLKTGRLEIEKNYTFPFQAYNSSAMPKVA